MLRELFASKSLIAALIVCGLVSVGIHFWSQHEHRKLRREEAATRRFVDSLPKPPVATPTVEEETQPGPTEETQERGSDDIGRKAVPPEVSESAKGESEIQTEANPEAPREADYDWREGSAHSHEPLHQPKLWQQVETAVERPVNVRDVTAEALRHQLIQRFGDIPQVHTFVEMGERVENGEQLTPEEYIAYIESMLHLFPSKQTAHSLEEIKRILRLYQVKGAPGGIRIQEVPQ